MSPATIYSQISELTSMRGILKENTWNLNPRLWLRQNDLRTTYNRSMNLQQDFREVVVVGKARKQSQLCTIWVTRDVGSAIELNTQPLRIACTNLTSITFPNSLSFRAISA